jgi:hypothetical protein
LNHDSGIDRGSSMMFFLLVLVVVALVYGLIWLGYYLRSNWHSPEPGTERGGATGGLGRAKQARPDAADESSTQVVVIMPDSTAMIGDTGAHAEAARAAMPSSKLRGTTGVPDGSASGSTSHSPDEAQRDTSREEAHATGAP